MIVFHKCRALSLSATLTSAALSFMSMLCVGCSDDFEAADTPATADSSVKFEASVSGSWNNGMSRAADSPQFPDTMFVMDSETVGDTIYLHAHTEINNINPFPSASSPGARGSLSSSLGGSFALFAGTFSSAWDESVNSADYIYNVECILNSRGYYAPASRYYWPDDSELKVFAYAPYNLLYFSLSGQSDAGSPKLTYAVTQIVKNQQDLLTASCVGAPDEDGLQDLTFSHALTAIRFVAADDIKQGSLKSISIYGVYSTATSIIGSNDWTAHGHPTDYSLNFSTPIPVGTAETAGAILAADPYTFIMMPQTLPDAAYIEIKFVDIADVERTLSAKIDGSKWLPGTIVTYAISTELTYIFTETDYVYKPMF